MPSLLIDITCSSHFRLSCICGVFFLRIYVADSRRVSVLTYFGKRGVTTWMPKFRIVRK